MSIEDAVNRLVGAGIVMACQSDDAERIISEAMHDEIEAKNIVIAVQNGIVWQDVMTGQWHRQGCRNFHDSIVASWREPPWTTIPRALKDADAEARR